MKKSKLKKRLKALEAFSHEPQEIAPRIRDEMERMIVLAAAFKDVPYHNLMNAAHMGLDTYEKAQ